MAFRPVTKTPAPSKKRSGTHRKHSQQYLRHYWPYLPLIGIVSLGLLLSAAWPSGNHAVLGAQSDLSRTSLLSDTNQQRQQSHEASLSLNDQLTSAAESKAHDMVASNYWSHTTPDGKTPWSFIVKSGYDYSRAGENLAYGFSDAAATVNAWMNSPEHRANILDNAYTQVGFGVASSPDYVGQGPATVIVAMYARPAESSQPVVTSTGSSSGGVVKGAETAARPISRLAMLGSQPAAQTETLVVLAIAVAATALFIVRHGRLLHRSLVRGEVFVLTHPLLDYVIIVVATGGYIVTRTAGFIL